MSSNNCEECDDEVETTPTTSIIELTKYRIIFLSENITKETSNTLASLLFYYEALDPEKEIKIFLTSNGGDADAFIHMYDAINMIKSPVKIITIGKAYSAGALLLSCGKNGLRCAFKNSKVMIHQLQCVFPVFGETQISENSNYFNYLEEYNKEILAILADNTGRSLNKVSEDCKKDLYLTPKQALKYGIIDFIVDDISQLIGDVSNEPPELKLTEMQDKALKAFLMKIKDLKIEEIEHILLKLDMIESQGEEACCEGEECNGECQEGMIYLTEEQQEALSIFAASIKDMTDEEVKSILSKIDIDI